MKSLALVEVKIGDRVHHLHPDVADEIGYARGFIKAMDAMANGQVQPSQGAMSRPGHPAWSQPSRHVADVDALRAASQAAHDEYEDYLTNAHKRRD
jgi:hypothetical protein